MPLHKTTLTPQCTMDTVLAAKVWKRVQAPGTSTLVPSPAFQTHEFIKILIPVLHPGGEGNILISVSYASSWLNAK